MMLCISFDFLSSSLMVRLIAVSANTNWSQGIDASQEMHTDLLKIFQSFDRYLVKLIKRLICHINNPLPS